MSSKIRGNDLVGKTVVSEEKGQTFGDVDDVSFVAETGELMNVLVSNPSKHLSDINLEQDSESRYMVPFSAVKSVGDFVIVSQSDIV